jgi:hypothetical protein
MGAGDEVSHQSSRISVRGWPRLRVQFENLAKAYVRLVEQADRNRRVVVYEPPPPKIGDTDLTK